MDINLSLALEVILGRLWILGVLALADGLAGVIKAVIAKEFSWDYLADWVGKKVFPKIGGWLLVAFVAYAVPVDQVPEAWGTVGPALEISAFATVGGYLFFSFLGNVQALGILPEGMARRDTAGGQFLIPKDKGPGLPPGDG